MLLATLVLSLLTSFANADAELDYPALQIDERIGALMEGHPHDQHQ
jgi:hypothetical protein